MEAKRHATRALFVIVLSAAWLGCEGNTFTNDVDFIGQYTSDEQRLAWGQFDRPESFDPDANFAYRFDDLPTRGEADIAPWAGDYWPTYKDSINQRWNGNEESPAEKFAAAFNKPHVPDGVSWHYGVRSQRMADTCTATADCDIEFGNTKVCAKRRGEERGYCVEDWTGICHAWAPAAIMEPEPLRAVTHNGVEFSVTDIKALVTLAYDKGLQSTLIGTRCNLDLGDPSGINFDDFGRPLPYRDRNSQEVDCRDTNPGTLHVALANLVGIQGRSLVEDRTVDYQVWNQPIRGYEVLNFEEKTAFEANALIGVVAGGSSESQSDTGVARRDWRHFGPFTVEAGRRVVARTTGDGDLDLYVRFGAQPTQSEHDCRSISETSTEACVLDVPENATDVYISVFAFAVEDDDEGLQFSLNMNTNGTTPDTYVLNDLATRLIQVRTRVDWIAEAHATPANDGNLASSIDRFTQADVYDYILELDSAGHIIGGEWLGASKTSHPDFLWLPETKVEVEVAQAPETMLRRTGVAVPEGELVQVDSVPVADGETVEVFMQGSGNGDMYLRLGAPPTLDTYNCKPTRVGSAEMCGGTVSGAVNELFIAVRGAAPNTVVDIESIRIRPNSGITWAEVQLLLALSTNVDPCATDNGGCGDTRWSQCNDVNGVAVCTDIDECAIENGGCGDTRFTTCTNNAGAAPTCADIDECAIDNGGCGDTRFTTCTNNAGAAPTCADIDECAIANGGCGDAQFTTCTNNAGAAPTCADIDECAVENGGCGDVQRFRCVNLAGAPPVCEAMLNQGSNSNERACQLYRLNRRYGLYSSGDLRLDWGGLGDKWIRIGYGGWMFMLPNGELYRWDGQPRPIRGELIATLDATVYDDLSQLYAPPVLPETCSSEQDREPIQTLLKRAFEIDQTLQFRTTGRFFDNWGGRGEKWLTTEDNQWYFIEPDGTLVRWAGGSLRNGRLVATLSAEFFQRPDRLTNARDPAVDNCLAAGDTYTAYDLDQELALGQRHGDYAEDWGGLGEKWLGSGRGDWYFIVPDGTLYQWDTGTSPPRGVEVARLSPSYHANPGALHGAAYPEPGFCSVADDPDLSVSLDDVAAEVDASLGLSSHGNYALNWGGRQEKWIAGAGGQWYYLLPDGSFYRWAAGSRPIDGELIVTLSAEFYDQPARLHDAAQN
ncbi:MAG: hypothetical protein VX589_00495 [Myxococcota bacterium]|nr:hypothetical protein [Myxococcota bacterium]